MNMELSEDEQLEALKKWWKNNGTAVIIGVVVGISVVVGVWKWREYKETQALEASDIYVSFNEAITKSDEGQITKQFEKLKAEYSGTSYAMLAAMYMAKRAVDTGDLSGAEAYLKWALDHSGHAALQHVARIRLAKIYIAQNKYDLALPLVEKQTDKAFVAQYSELKGDIFRHQGKLDQARLAYQAALDAGTMTGKRRELLQMKLTELPETTDKPANGPA